MATTPRAPTSPSWRLALTWHFAGAMLAQTAVILAAVIGAAVAILRVLGS